MTEEQGVSYRSRNWIQGIERAPVYRVMKITTVISGTTVVMWFSPGGKGEYKKPLSWPGSGQCHTNKRNRSETKKEKGKEKEEEEEGRGRRKGEVQKPSFSLA